MTNFYYLGVHFRKNGWEPVVNASIQVIPVNIFWVMLLYMYTCVFYDLKNWFESNPFKKQAFCFVLRSATRDTIEMTRKMAEAGADAVLVVTPCYYKGRMTNNALQEHFRKVCNKCS